MLSKKFTSNITRAVAVAAVSVAILGSAFINASWAMNEEEKEITLINQKLAEQAAQDYRDERKAKENLASMRDRFYRDQSLVNHYMQEERKLCSENGLPINEDDIIRNAHLKLNAEKNKNPWRSFLY